MNDMHLTPVQRALKARIQKYIDGIAAVIADIEEEGTDPTPALSALLLVSCDVTRKAGSELPELVSQLRQTWRNTEDSAPMEH